MNNIRDAIQSFNMNSLKPTLVEVRHLDGSTTKINKYGLEIEKIDKFTRPEPSFSSHGFIPNFNLDLQIGKINLPEFTILFGSVDVAKDLDLLKLNKVTHIINLISNITPNYFPEFFHYLSLTVYDNLKFQLNDTINECCNFLNNVKQYNGCCFIHCEAGISRAPSIIIAYLIRIYNYSYEKAYNLVNNSRNICINVNFKSQLMKLN
ncbi:putative dual specificity protein phosphatase [Schistosoma mansoni]|uniref:Dual specificity protein phosphatase n=1 Tax=Schistosoma mansoni TaxID=6183 RepID=A0A5K4FD27_SCHMA|nr:putative dual specificity protein phosphatase [Schistosoma mansoni]|eukprot:XP_018651271.1 putative dual specificity protein phosphatase [Schistosoma mansoni]